MLYPSFVYVTRSMLFGSAVIAADTLESVADSSIRNAFVASASGQAIDSDGVIDLAAAGYSKLAALVLSLSGSTPITVDFNALAAATGVQVAGATSFATWKALLIQNVGAQALVLSPGSSDPLTLPIGGTSPTHTLDAGDEGYWLSSAGTTVSASACNLTVTPTAGGTLFLAFGGGVMAGQGAKGPGAAELRAWLAGRHAACAVRGCRGRPVMLRRSSTSETALCAVHAQGDGDRFKPAASSGHGSLSGVPDHVGAARARERELSRRRRKGQ